jgi:hypothetical protein
MDAPNVTVRKFRIDGRHFRAVGKLVSVEGKVGAGFSLLCNSLQVETSERNAERQHPGEYCLQRTAMFGAWTPTSANTTRKCHGSKEEGRNLCHLGKDSGLIAVSN